MKRTVVIILITFLFTQTLPSDSVLPSLKEYDSPQYASVTQFGYSSTTFELELELELEDTGSYEFRIQAAVSLSNGSTIFAAKCSQCFGNEPIVNGYNIPCQESEDNPNGNCWILINVGQDGSWEWIYSIPTPREFNRLIGTPDGGFFVSGLVYHSLTFGPFIDETYTYSHPDNDNNCTLFILKFDDKITLEWSHSMGVSNDGDIDLEISKTGKIAYAVNQKEHTEISGYDLTWGQMVVGLDEFGQVIFVEELDEDYQATYGEMLWTDSGLVIEILNIQTNQVPMNGGDIIAEGGASNVGLLSLEGEWMWMVFLQPVGGCYSNGIVEIEEVVENQFALLMNQYGAVCEHTKVLEITVESNNASIGRSVDLLSGMRLIEMEFIDDESFVVFAYHYISSGTSENEVCFIDCWRPSNSLVYLAGASLNGDKNGIQQTWRFTYSNQITDFEFILNDEKIILHGVVDQAYPVSEYFTISIDRDDDFDTVPNLYDSCYTNYSDWYTLTPNNQADHDRDGCKDNFEDTDDDNDGLQDEIDSCPLSVNDDYTSQYNLQSKNWSVFVDHDMDGCHDSEDWDDDGDEIQDYDDYCQTGMKNWTSNESSDHDNDGCMDASEDFDDDNDGFNDTDDSCPKGGTVGWRAYLFDNYDQDHDQDGCRSDVEDLDNDGDTFSNELDAFPYNSSEWSDNDNDGLGDNADLDDDNDGWNDIEDACPIVFGTANITEKGCIDTDMDGYSNQTDTCPMTYGQSFIDRLGCLDQDADGVSDLNDIEPYNAEIGVDEYDGPRVDLSDDTSENQTNLKTNDGTPKGELGSIASFSFLGILLIVGVIFFIRSKRSNDADGNDEIMEEKLESNDFDDNIPEYSLKGEVHENGFEVLEYPKDSATWWWKDEENRCWVIWE